MISLILSFATLILFLILSSIFYYEKCYYTPYSNHSTKKKVALLSNKPITIKNTLYIDYKVFRTDDIYLSLKYIKDNNFDLIIGCENFPQYSSIKANINNIPLICTGPTLNHTMEPTLSNDVFMCLDMESIMIKLFEYYSSLYKLTYPDLIKNVYLVNNINNYYMGAFLAAAIKYLTNDINISNYMKTNILHNLSSVPSNALLVLYASNGIDLEPTDRKSEREIPLIFLNINNNTKYARYKTNKLIFESYTIQQLTNVRFENNYIEQYIQNTENKDSSFTYTMPLEYIDFNLLLAIEYMNKYKGEENILEYVSKLNSINDTMFYYKISEDMFGQQLVGEWPIYNLTTMQPMEYLIIKVDKITTILTDRLGKLLCIPDKYIELIIPKNNFMIIN